MKGRRKLFRIAAICLSLLILVSIEAACRFFDSGAASSNAFVEYLGQRPLFALDEDERVYRIAENRRTYFADDSFPEDLTAGTKRVFVLGGSTVQGRPYSLPTSFPTCLQTALNFAAPDVEWDVVNCGGVSYASYRLLPILDEVLKYDPAAIIVCTGQNEFLEFMTYQDAVQAVNSFGETAVGWTNLASVRMARRLFVDETVKSPSKRKPRSQGSLPIEVDALLDQSDGWAKYHRDGLERDRIERQFARNLSLMTAACAERNVPLLLVSPPVNLRDCPPFKSEFDASVDEVQQQLFLDQLAAAAQLGVASALDSKSTEAEDRLKSLCDQQPEYALAWYQLGRCLYGRKKISKAADAFQTACDEDICPLRMTSRLKAAMDQVVSATGVPFVDLQQFLQQESRHEIVGSDLLVDHVHPSFGSQRKIGCLLAQRLLQVLQVDSVDGDWEPVARAHMQSDFEKLDSLYFLRGQRALDNLNGWARGRAHGTELNSSGD